MLSWSMRPHTTSKFRGIRNPFHGRFTHKKARFWYAKLMNIWIFHCCMWSIHQDPITCEKKHFLRNCYLLNNASFCTFFCPNWSIIPSSMGPWRLSQKQNFVILEAKSMLNRSSPESSKTQHDLNDWAIQTYVKGTKRSVT